MAQYLQMGICHQITIIKQETAEATKERIQSTLGKRVDLNLFNFEETEQQMSYSIKESLIKEQLYDFLKDQFALYDEHYKVEFSSVLSKLAEKQSIGQIIELAKEKEFRFFQQSDLDEYIEISPWRRANVKILLLTFFMEGKLLMECYDSYLRYMEKLVRASSKQAIAGAFRAYIG